MKCSECKVDYSDRVILLSVHSSRGVSKPVCGICALEIVREMHNHPGYTFSGEIALEQYQLALEERWRIENSFKKEVKKSEKGNS